MRLNKTVALFATMAAMAGGALVLAAPASANDEGPVISGHLYLYNTRPTVGTNHQAGTVLNSPNALTVTGSGRTWMGVWIDTACPTGAVSYQAYLRIPQAGVAENLWDQIPVSGLALASNSYDGKPYLDRSDPIQDAAQIQTYLSTDADHTVDIPLVVTCRDASNVALGNFRTIVTVAGTGAVGAQTLTFPASPVVSTGVATTTALTVTATTGGATLAASVTPAAAVGNVVFSDGSTALYTVPLSGGTASYTAAGLSTGSHTFSAAFVPTDVNAFGPSTSPSVGATVTDANSGNITLTVPTAGTGQEGSLYYVCSFDSAIQLGGVRSSDNSRITATAAFKPVTVHDTRVNTTGPWQVNASATEFAKSGGGYTIGAKYLGWTPIAPVITPEPGSPLTATAGSAVASFLDNAASTGLGTASLLGSSAAGGLGTTLLTANLNLAIPGLTPAGTYNSVVTVTLVG